MKSYKQALEMKLRRFQFHKHLPSIYCYVLTSTLDTLLSFWRSHSLSSNAPWCHSWGRGLEWKQCLLTMGNFLYPNAIYSTICLPDRSVYLQSPICWCKTKAFRLNRCPWWIYLSLSCINYIHNALSKVSIFIFNIKW